MTWRIAVRRNRPSSRSALRAGAVFAAAVTALGLAATAPAEAATSYHLRVSATADRAASHALASSKLRGAEYVFVDPATSVKSVAFYIDDPKRVHKASRVDSTQPYDLRGGSSTAATAWNTANLKDGKHTVTAVVTTTAGHKSVGHVGVHCQQPDTQTGRHGSQGRQRPGDADLGQRRRSHRRLPDLSVDVEPRVLQEADQRQAADQDDVLLHRQDREERHDVLLRHPRDQHLARLGLRRSGVRPPAGAPQPPDRGHGALP